jgi:hypothetical protein
MGHEDEAFADLQASLWAGLCASTVALLEAVVEARLDALVGHFLDDARGVRQLRCEVGWHHRRGQSRGAWGESRGSRSLLRLPATGTGIAHRNRNLTNRNLTNRTPTSRPHSPS